MQGQDKGDEDNVCTTSCPTVSYQGGLLSRTTLLSIDKERDTFQWDHNSASDPLLTKDWRDFGDRSPLFEVPELDTPTAPPATVSEELAATFRENLRGVTKR